MIDRTDCDILFAAHRANTERINARGWQARPTGSGKKVGDAIAVALVALAARLASAAAGRLAADCPTIGATRP